MSMSLSRYLARDSSRSLTKSHGTRSTLCLSNFLPHLNHLSSVNRPPIHPPQAVLFIQLGEKHSFMHDLKSFFWVLFWICIHSDATVSRVMLRFEKWNYMDMGHLAQLKKGTVVHGGDFIDVVNKYFTEYYRPLGYG